MVEKMFSSFSLQGILTPVTANWRSITAENLIEFDG